MDIHFTWVGPPRYNREKKNDVIGPNSLASAKFRMDPAGPPPDIYFHCLRKHQNAYTNYFSRRRQITVCAIEDVLEEYTQFEARKINQNIVVNPNNVSIDQAVHYIFTTSTRVGCSVREIVNAKNLWSFYLLYKKGGMTMDTGIVKDPRAANVKLKNWDTFKVPARKGNTASVFRDVQLRVQPYFAGVCSTVYRGIGSLILDLGLQDIRSSSGKAAKVRHPDVWTMYSPAGHKAAKKALEWYIRVWFVLERVRKEYGNDHDIYKDTCRTAVISAVLTGMTHSKTRLSRHGCNGNSYGRHCWDAILTGKASGIPELGIKKHYFRSHVQGH